MTENEIGTIIVETAIKIHRDLGPGLLESVYEMILADALQKQGLDVERQKKIPIEYKGHVYEESFRADIVVANKVIVEVKSVKEIHSSHKKQVLTYLKFTKYKLGYVLNFGAELMKDGISRTIHGRLEP